MYRNLQRNSGFTIVELLIVIVVIAILAAITIVAFRGVQTRAHDSSVQSDLNGMQKKVQAAKVTGDLPTTAEQFSTLLKPSQSYGAQDQYPLIALKTETDGTFDGFSFYALSRSGKVFSANGGTVARGAAEDSIDDIILYLQTDLQDFQDYLAESQAANDTEEIAWAQSMITRTQARLEKANQAKQAGTDLWSLEATQQGGTVIVSKEPMQINYDNLVRRSVQTSPNCSNYYYDGYSYDLTQSVWVPLTVNAGSGCAS